METDLQAKIRELNKKLQESPTAYSGSLSPSKSDVSIDKQISSVNQQIEDLKSKEIANKWYGKEDKTTTEGASKPEGIVIKGLKALSKPLNAVMGTAQYALGKGTESSLGSNINAATKSGLTAGDILKQYGVGRGVQIPLGFALDVMFDPVTWLTAGTSALVPRVGTGIVRGAMKKGGTEAVESGLEGALKGGWQGLKSGIQKDASFVANMVPLAKKISTMEPVVEEMGKKSAVRSAVIKGATKYTDFTENLAKKAITSSEKYDRLIGQSVYDRLGTGIIPGVTSRTAFNALEKGVKKLPYGEKIADFFRYSPETAAKAVDVRDTARNIAKEQGATLAKEGNFATVSEFLDPKATISIKNKEGEAMEIAIRDADGVLNKNYTKQYTITDTKKNAEDLLSIAKVDFDKNALKQAYKVTEPGKTGFNWYDKKIDELKSTTIDDIFHGKLGKVEKATETVQKEADNLVKTVNAYGKIKNFKPLEKILTVYPKFISLFKSTKVPMNPSSHVVANIGNFFMGAMMGLPVWKSEYYNSMMKAKNLLKGKLGTKEIKEMFFDDASLFFDMMKNNPGRFRQLTGLDPKEIDVMLSVKEKIASNITKENSYKEAANYLEEVWNKIDIGSEQGKRADKLIEIEESLSSEQRKALNKEIPEYSTASETLKRDFESGPITASDDMSSWTTSELSQQAETVSKIKAKIASDLKNNPNNPIYQIANFVVNSMPKGYERIDQIWKIGTTDFLTHTGVGEEELIKLSRSVPITKNDITEVITKGAEKTYKLKPLKASEVAMEAYMNYAAMPDFVKMMRAIPIVGSSFFSFPYAMAIKSAKTAIDNPAIFNKVGFAMEEMNAGRTPQEKAAMDDKYNQYLKSPTVVKMFGMWNTNVKNWIPWYTMNMFNPSERNYGNSTQAEIMKATDKLPLFQDPVGQVLKDYWIQPWILAGSGEVAQGQFGQPLFPAYDEKTGEAIDIGLKDKLPYALRSIGEAIVPGIAGYAGVVNAPLDLPTEAIQAVPSYGFRSVAEATQGKSSIGKQTKEDAVRKTLRAVLSRTGIPAYMLDPTKVSSE